MSDHLALMTWPRSGPHQECEKLRAAGFIPVPSTRSKGRYSFWVAHFWGLSDADLKLECAEVAASMPEYQFAAIDEIGQVVDLTANIDFFKGLATHDT